MYLPPADSQRNVAESLVKLAVRFLEILVVSSCIAVRIHLVKFLIDCELGFVTSSDQSTVTGSMVG